MSVLEQNNTHKYGLSGNILAPLFWKIAQWNYLLSNTQTDIDDGNENDDNGDSDNNSIYPYSVHFICIEIQCSKTLQNKPVSA